MSIPLVQNNEKDSINTSIIAIKRQIERINMLLGLVDSGSPDLSGLATKQELEDAITQVETDLAPVDEVTSGNMQSVTSNAVSRAMSYSTEEVNTGKKWINGKDIYSKTYYNVSNFPHRAGLTNVDEITKIYAEAKDVGSNFFPLPFVTVIDGVTYYTNIFYNKNVNTIYSDSNSNVKSVNITLEYTKTN